MKKKGKKQPRKHTRQYKSLSNEKQDYQAVCFIIGVSRGLEFLYFKEKKWKHYNELSTLSERIILG